MPGFARRDVIKVARVEVLHKFGGQGEQMLKKIYIEETRLVAIDEKWFRAPRGQARTAGA